MVLSYLVSGNICSNIPAWMVYLEVFTWESWDGFGKEEGAAEKPYLVAACGQAHIEATVG